MDTLKKGSSGDSVKVLQWFLNIDADGRFGPITESAVKSVQYHAEIKEDGICGPKTWTYLSQALPTLKEGASGRHVNALQTLLQITADGKYGTNTKNAVAAFQTAHSLSSDGICGQKTWDKLINGATIQVADDSKPSDPVKPSTGTFVQPRDVKQYSSPWGPKMYSVTGDKKQTYKSSGCGPTSACGPLETLTGKRYNPDDLGKLAIEWGCRTSNSGTTTSFFKKLADKFGLKYKSTKDENEVADALKSGKYVIARMGKGYWTKGGHYISLWKCDATYFYANDPASSSRKKATISSFKKERKDYHILSK